VHLQGKKSLQAIGFVSFVFICMFILRIYPILFPDGHVIKRSRAITTNLLSDAKVLWSLVCRLHTPFPGAHIGVHEGEFVRKNKKLKRVTVKQV